MNLSPGIYENSGRQCDNLNWTSPLAYILHLFLEATAQLFMIPSLCDNFGISTELFSSFSDEPKNVKIIARLRTALITCDKIVKPLDSHLQLYTLVHQPTVVLK